MSFGRILKKMKQAIILQESKRMSWD
jgi:hypothetical protein